VSRRARSPGHRVSGPLSTRSALQRIDPQALLPPGRTGQLAGQGL